MYYMRKLQPPYFDAATIERLLPPAVALRAAERAFAGLRGDGAQPPPLTIELPRGSAHVKAAALPPHAALLAIKANVNLPGNPERHGLPTIQGLVLAFDGERGLPLAVLDSASLTARRTAAATALAARWLARPDADALTLIGCGVQGRAHLELLRRLLPLRHIYLHDRDPHRARQLARAARVGFDGELRCVTRAADGTRRSPIVVCCTTARRPFLRLADVMPGAFVAAVGADHAGKRELDDDLLAAARLVVDSRAQAAAMGEWRHARRSRRTRPPELGEIVRGARRGRLDAEQILVFDSTGFALQDCCAVDAVLDAWRAGGGRRPAATTGARP
jgi:ornithine cyclodeaminase/alanine dehydrogenase-like protein (mu-crystallin family)